jgi:predicted metal-dependent peptidase
MRQVTKLDKAKAQIVMDYPFFSSILFKRGLQEDRTIPTLAVPLKGAIKYNPDFIEGLPVPQIVWGLCHEVGHVIAQHSIRRKHRDPKKWNYAGDAWINDMLDDCKVGERIPDCVDMPGSKDKTTEAIYDELPDGDDGGGGGGSGGGNPDKFDNGLGDDVEYGDQLTESEIREIEAQAKVDIAEAAQAAKARGKLPGKLANIVADIINVKTPWHDILERYMVSMTKGEYTWMRPNRRFIGQGHYLPSTGKTPTMGEVVLQVDISGSVSQKETDYYNGHIKRIIDMCKPSKVHVIYTDTEVQQHDEYDNPEEVQIQFKSGGGTRMEAGFDFIAEQGIQPDVVVTLTDGYDDYTEDPGFPTVWCVSSPNKTVPYGETIHFEIN